MRTAEIRLIEQKDDDYKAFLAMRELQQVLRGVAIGVAIV